MDKTKYKSFLSTVRTSKNEPLTSISINSRVNEVCRVEKEFNVLMDDVVTDKEKTLDLIESIMQSKNLTERQKNNFPNGVRYYYEFVNGTKLGTLRENNRK